MSNRTKEKAENLKGVFEDLKIVDWGAARFKYDIIKPYHYHGNCTIWYKDPSLISSSSSYNLDHNKCDIWSVGSIILYILCKKKRIGPARAEDNRTLFYKKDISLLARNGFDFETSKKVMDITNNEGVPAVFDGVGKNTFYDSLACLKTRGMMVSFGNASGPLDPVNVPKDIQPKGLYLTRPSIAQYFTNRKELQAGADTIFEKVKFGKIKVNISKEYNLIDALKIACRKFTKEKTGKKPFTNINLVNI